MRRHVAYAVHVGSIKAKSFGWARHDPEEVGTPAGTTGDATRNGADIGALVEALADDLGANRPVSLGLTAPLALPLRDDPLEFTNAREGERGRTWSSGAGPAAIATGLVEAVWILTKVRLALGEAPPVFMGVDAWRAIPRGLFVYEVMAQDTPRGTSPEAVCAHAAASFAERLDSLRAPPRTGDPVLNVMGAALARAGWIHDTRLFETPPLVLDLDMSDVAGSVADRVVAASKRS